MGQHEAEDKAIPTQKALIARNCKCPHVTRGACNKRWPLVFFTLDNVKESLADEDTYPLYIGWVRNCTCLTLTALASMGKDSLPASLQSPSQGGSKSTGDHYSSCAIQSCLFSRGHRGGGAPRWRPWANSTMSELHGPSVPSPAPWP